MYAGVVHRLGVSGSLGAAMIPTWPGDPPRLLSEGADASVRCGDFDRARRDSGRAWGHQTRCADSIDISLARSDRLAMRNDELPERRGSRAGVFVGEVCA